MTTTIEPLMKTVEVAEALGVSTRMVLSMSDPSNPDRSLERVTLGTKTIRFRRAAVEELIENGAQS